MNTAVVKNANLALSFILELCLLAAFGAWGVHAGENLALKVLLGVGAPLLTAVFWGVFMAPKSPYQLWSPLYLIVKTILFALAVIALAASGYPVLAWALGIAFVANMLLGFL